MTYGYPALPEVQQRFTAEGVVPDVLASFNPTGLLYLTYTGNLSDGTNAKVVLPGTSFARNDTLNTPQFSVDGVKNGTYIIAIVDPDAPSRANPTVSQIRHMFATNFVVSDTRSTSAARSMVLQNTTSAISPYFSPNPPVGSGAHRYIALLYAQPDNFDFSSLNATQFAKFNISRFAASTGLGDPLAGTFLTVEQKA
ncbi:OV-16 antigen OS=Onchocerca volvulus GN=OV16 PE=2 SV=2 [Rhizoctonia solani AG-1 IB]|uniref:OV-16 antigen n=1 Tax=Thanatephorus cucumeris (strain AG1-IB / isolate 7/3/14) TaxID=1108050 RepID=A0A0B7FU58_THACB|nr:OV-16 antigen OS=Onchocerca volvulus GN=OV16 PE=2 SV=2 [Rhizoctonia solani AG-1 IB]